jgi:hypothetical protein
MRDQKSSNREAELPAPTRIGSGDWLGRILIACEYSATVREAFARRGWDAWSCDILPSEVPGNHYQEDIFKLLARTYWDAIIFHWPCTLLCNSGVRWLYGGKGNVRDIGRWVQMEQSARNFKRLLNCNCKYIAGENPIMHKYAAEIVGTKYTQIVQPWQFGHGETKATCLWLKNLPPLMPTNIVPGREQRIWKLPPSENRGLERSRTYTGIAEAMADQWTRAMRPNIRS